jgi:hypothetical protein
MLHHLFFVYSVSHIFHHFFSLSLYIMYINTDLYHWFNRGFPFIYRNTWRYWFGKMSTFNWNLLSVVHSLDTVKVVAKSNRACQFRINNLKNSTKYSFKCCQYRKYPLCNYELKATVSDDDPNSITVMCRNCHNHEYRTETSRVPSPIRQSVSKYVHVGLTVSQIRASLDLDQFISSYW